MTLQWSVACGAPQCGKHCQCVSGPYCGGSADEGNGEVDIERTGERDSATRLHQLFPAA